MLEQLLPEIDLTKEQNLAIKRVYIIFRDLLAELTTSALAMDVTPENCKTTFYKVWQDYEPVHSVGAVKIEKDKKSVTPTMLVHFPDSIRKFLPKLAKTVELVIRLSDGGSNAEFNSYNGIKFELVVRLPEMLKNFESYKVSLQHEMQHIIDAGGSEDDTIENGFVRGMVYTLIPGEIKAHAKQYAYMYYKKFPSDNQLDFEKFKKEFFEKGNVKLDNYIKYGDRPEKIRKVYNLSDDLYQKMVNGFKDFKTALIRSFLYFKEK
jgi:hypothetical protein